MFEIQEKIWEDDVWVKHITLEGSRFHVISWSSNGSGCSNRNCINNAPEEIKLKAFMEGKL